MSPSITHTWTDLCTFWRRGDEARTRYYRRLAASPPRRLAASPPRASSPPRLLAASPPRRLAASPPRRLAASPPRRLASSPPRAASRRLAPPRAASPPRRLAASSPPRLLASSPPRLLAVRSCEERPSETLSNRERAKKKIVSQADNLLLCPPLYQNEGGCPRMRPSSCAVAGCG